MSNAPPGMLAGSPVYGTRVMVTSAHHAATETGLRMLAAGGTAVDAVVAAAITLTVAVPPATSAGGDLTLLLWDAPGGALHALDATGRAPRALNARAVAASGARTMPWRGPLTVTVPGAIDGWFTALQRFGALPVDAVFARAIDLAESGVPVTPGLAAWIAKDAAPVLRGWRSDPGLYLPGGRPPRPGDLLRQRDLARTYRLLAREGPDAFYRGPLGRAVVNDVRRRGGVLQVDDLERHASRWVPALAARYRGHEVHTFPPPSQGVAALAALNVLDGLDASALGHHTPAHLHLLVEVARLAMADRDAHVSDPAFADVPVERLLGPEHASELRGRLDPERALPAGGAAPVPAGDTVVACAVDAAGSLAVLMQSLGSPFGSGVLVDGTGLLLHNRGSYFSLDPRHVNFLQPRKRTMHTFMPAIVCRGGAPVLGLGSIGGDVQPQALLQVLSAVLDFDLDAQRAIVAPRWRSRRLVWGEGGDVRELNGQRAAGEAGAPDGLLCEDRFPEATLEELRRLGHRVLVRCAWDPSMGPTQAVAVRPGSGVREGAFDPRTDGLALGW